MGTETSRDEGVGRKPTTGVTRRSLLQAASVGVFCVPGTSSSSGVPNVWSRPGSRAVAGEPVTQIPAGSGSLHLSRGGTYKLAGDVFGPILITGQGVVLDGDGHSITSGYDVAGITLVGATDAGIRNVTVVPRDSGIVGHRVGAVSLTDVTVYGGADGVRFDDEIIASTVPVDPDRQAGTDATSQTAETPTTVQASTVVVVNAAGHGFSLDSTAGTFSQCQAIHCGRNEEYHGIKSASPSGLTLDQCVVSGAGGYGYLFTDGTGETAGAQSAVVVSNSLARDCGASGFFAMRVDDVRLACDWSTGNREHGFGLLNNGQVTLVRNSAVDNGQYGHLMESNTSARYFELRAADNGIEDLAARAGATEVTDGSEVDASTCVKPKELTEATLPPVTSKTGAV
ncbi:right-handed parallel beta-helix repeat-containing protein [Haloarchaeobius sp. DFWS5]|uniref:right-handed parallel beta-helix repeat-containing protein n=1 Tax=Haloarchaeobius sp. DFWS5 TaxID=3446114 RepID=UPI003EC0FFE3